MVISCDMLVTHSFDYSENPASPRAAKRHSAAWACPGVVRPPRRCWTGAARIVNRPRILFAIGPDDYHTHKRESPPSPWRWSCDPCGQVHSIRDELDGGRPEATRAS